MGMNLEKVFDQYLRDARIPILEYYQQDGALHYRWTSAVKDFDMVVDVLVNGSTKRLQPKTSWQKLAGAPVQILEVDPDYYVGVSKSR
jgi:hypothetical protein